MHETLIPSIHIPVVSKIVKTNQKNFFIIIFAPLCKELKPMWTEYPWGTFSSPSKASLVLQERGKCCKIGTFSRASSPRYEILFHKNWNIGFNQQQKPIVNWFCSFAVISKFFTFFSIQQCLLKLMSLFAATDFPFSFYTIRIQRVKICCNYDLFFFTLFTRVFTGQRTY